MGYIYGTLSLFLIALVAHGLWTGAIFVKTGPDVRRSERPTLFYFMVVCYLLVAAFLARWALFDFFHW